VLTQDINFSPNNASAYVEAGFCQRGSMGFRVAQELSDTARIWVKRSRPRYAIVGGIPIVFSTLAYLELTVTASGRFEVKPLLDFQTVERYQITYPGSDTDEVRTPERTFEVGYLNNAQAEISATTTLSPALKVSIYGSGGPYASFETQVKAERAFSGRQPNGDISGELSTALNVGIDSRLIKNGWQHPVIERTCSFTRNNQGATVSSC
jgi:hypothetical protein